MRKNPPDYTPEQLQAMQSKSGQTNAVFADGLGVTSRTWEVWKFGKRPIKKVYRRAIADYERELTTKGDKHGKRTKAA